MRNYILKQGIYMNPNSEFSPFPDEGEPGKDDDRSGKDGGSGKDSGSGKDDNGSRDYVLELIRNASDLSTGSEELFLGMKDWSSNYALNPRRADLLRPFADILQGKSVLEIGSGAGSITRYLGELNCEVIALETSAGWARITNERCRDLQNVRVVCDTLQNFTVANDPDKFDVITLIGTLECSALFVDGINPAGEMLKKINHLLRPGGYVIIAAMNKLGLKYLAGAPEEHVDKPYFGIENRYNKSTPVTFGKEELQGLLSDSGLGQTSFLYPFPDYKMPKVILTEEGIKNDSFKKEELLIEKVEYFQSHAYVNHFSTSLSVEAFRKNELLSALSNSFLVLARKEQDEPVPAGNILGYTYNSTRRKPYCKENIFILSVNSGIEVLKKNMYPASTAGNQVLRQKVENEKYHKGRLLFTDMVTIISGEGWSLEDLGKWAAVYYNTLLAYAVQKDDKWFLPGKLVDLTPFNMIIDEEANTHIFDQEWEVDDDLPLEYVFFRGVRHSLGDVLFFNTPAEGVPLNMIDLTVGILDKVIPFNRDMIEDFLQRERKYFSGLVMGTIHSFDSGTIFIRGTYALEKYLQQKEGELHVSQDQLQQRESGLLALRDRLLQKDSDVTTLHNYLQQSELVSKAKESDLSDFDRLMTEVLTNVESLEKETDLLRQKLTLSASQLQEKDTMIQDADASLFQSMTDLALILNKLDSMQEDLVQEKQKNQALQNDKEWFVRTYEKKSLFGIVKDRIHVRIQHFF